MFAGSAQLGNEVAQSTVGVEWKYAVSWGALAYTNEEFISL